MTDKELVEQIVNGNNNAFRFLVASHQRLVVHIVGRIVQQGDEVEDICQEVFIKVFQKIKKFRGDAKLSTWIATIAYNTSISHLRKIKRRGEHSYDERPSLVAMEKDNELNQRIIEKQEIKKYLSDVVAGLPEKQDSDTLFHLEEFSYREIEDVTGMPEGTIKSYLSRARKLMKLKLEKVVN